MPLGRCAFPARCGRGRVFSKNLQNVTECCERYESGKPSAGKLKRVKLAVAHVETKFDRFAGESRDFGTVAPADGHED